MILKIKSFELKSFDKIQLEQFENQNQTSTFVLFFEKMLIKKVIIIFFFLLNLTQLFGQDINSSKSILSDSSFWTSKMLFGINGSQSSFVNWSAGGRNNISILGFMDGSTTYRKSNLKWNNDVKLALGGLRFLDKKNSGSKMQKTDDKIDIATSLGYEFKNKWFYTIVGGFKTQMLDGFVFPNDSIRTSKFLAPGYVSSALGIEFAPDKNFNIFLSPLATKFTIINDQVLANAGAFGVQKAEKDALGNVLVAGKKVRSEYGAYFKMRFNKELAKNIEMKSRFELFSNYLNNPQNIDINTEVIFTFKVNKWFSSSLQWNLLYDDDIDVTDIKGRVGPRTQFKSVLGLGVSFTIKNKNSI
jgi:hypothetical protein